MNEGWRNVPGARKVSVADHPLNLLRSDLIIIIELFL